MSYLGGGEFYMVHMAEYGDISRMIEDISLKQ